MVHGRMKAADKGYRDAEVYLGEAQILMATTVIEVGVNVAERIRHGDREC